MMLIVLRWFPHLTRRITNARKKRFSIFVSRNKKTRETICKTRSNYDDMKNYPMILDTPPESHVISVEVPMRFMSGMWLMNNNQSNLSEFNDDKKSMVFDKCSLSMQPNPSSNIRKFGSTG
jgi:hypothetical protein